MSSSHDSARTFFARRGCFILPKWACGEGINKGNFVPLISLGGLEPCEKVPSFLQLFFKKSWVKVLILPIHFLEGAGTCVH